MNNNIYIHTDSLLLKTTRNQTRIKEEAFEILTIPQEDVLEKLRFLVQKLNKLGIKQDSSDFILNQHYCI